MRFENKKIDFKNDTETHFSLNMALEWGEDENKELSITGKTEW